MYDERNQISGQTQEPYPRAERSWVTSLPVHSAQRHSGDMSLGSGQEHRSVGRLSTAVLGGQGAAAELLDEQGVGHLDESRRGLENATVRTRYFFLILSENFSPLKICHIQRIEFHWKVKWIYLCVLKWNRIIFFKKNANSLGKQLPLLNYQIFKVEFKMDKISAKTGSALCPLHIVQCSSTALHRTELQTARGCRTRCIEDSPHRPSSSDTVVREAELELKRLVESSAWGSDGQSGNLLISSNTCSVAQ